MTSINTVHVDSIIDPTVPLALRLSSHLLLGVVRIYSRKARYLLQDCSEAIVKIKMAFRPSVVDLDPDAAVAPFNAITLPETATDVPPADRVLDKLNMSRAEDITIDAHVEQGLLARLDEGAGGDAGGDFFGAGDDWLVFGGAGDRRPGADESLASIGVERLRDAERPSMAGFDDVEGARAGLSFMDQGLPVGGDDFGGDVGMGGFDLDVSKISGAGVDRESLAAGGLAGVGGVGNLSLSGDIQLPDTENIENLDFINVPREKEKEKRTLKRKLPFIDTMTELAGAEIRQGFNDRTDILRDITATTAHSTYRKRGIIELESAAADALFEELPLPGAASELLALIAPSIRKRREEEEEKEKERKKRKEEKKDKEQEKEKERENDDFGLGDLGIDLGGLDMGMEVPGMEVEVEIPEVEITPIPATPAVSGGADESLAIQTPQVGGEGEGAVQTESRSRVSAAGEASWSGRSVRMLKVLRSRFGKGEAAVPMLNYLDMVQGKKRRVVAGTFFELLVLKTRGYITLTQHVTFGDIEIGIDELFYTPIPE